MKALLLSCLLLTGLQAAGQSTSAPFKRANVVVVQTPDSATTALRKLATVFVSQGYTVDKLDAQFLTLTLTPKVLPEGHNPALVVRASASQGANSALKISGDYRASAGAMQVAGQAEYAGSPTGMNRSAFAELQKAAVAYPSGKVSYTKQ